MDVRPRPVASIREIYVLIWLMDPTLSWIRTLPLMEDLVSVILEIQHSPFLQEERLMLRATWGMMLITMLPMLSMGT